MKILTTSNHKLLKSNKVGYLTAGLSLAPHKHSGYNVCKDASPSCISVCNLWFAGRTVIGPVRAAMINRTKLFFENRRAFERLLVEDIESLSRKAKRENKKLAIRLNTASDLPWETLMPDVFRKFKDVEFYDYTKIFSRVQKSTAPSFPANYQLTYSWNERSNLHDVCSILKSGTNVAFVTNLEYNKRTGYMAPIPEFFNLGKYEFMCTDGDTHDLRLRSMDGAGRAVLLRFKGARKSMENVIKSGFVREI